MGVFWMSSIVPHTPIKWTVSILTLLSCPFTNFRHWVSTFNTNIMTHTRHKNKMWHLQTGLQEKHGVLSDFRTVWLWTCRERNKGSQASFPEKGVAGDAVQQVMRLSLWRFSQWKDLLLRHAGWDGDMTLVKWVKVLVQVLGVWGDRTRVTNI